MPAPVQGHADLVSSDPPANASLPAAPAEVRLTFTEAIDAASARLTLLDSTQTAVEGVGPAAVHGNALHAAIPSLGPGVYTVDYQVASAVDGHVTTGQFAFLIDPTGLQAAPTSPTESGSPSSAPEVTIARWLALLATLALMGLSLFWLVSARPVLADPGDARRSAPWGTLALLAVLAVSGMAIYLALAARPLLTSGVHAGHGGGFPLDFAAPFGWTPFAIAMRIALAGSAVAFIVAVARYFAVDEARRRVRTVREAPRHDDRWLMVVVVVAAVTLAGSSLGGHAAAIGGPALAALDWLHLLAVAAWLGTLPGLLRLAARLQGDRERGALLKAALGRHSRIAIVAALVVVATGLANSPFMLGDQRELVASGYGNLLLAKALLFSLALGMGAAGYFLVRRRGIGPALAVVGAELVVGAVAVLVAAGMVTGQPGASRVPVLTSGPVGTLHLFGAAGESAVHVAVNLPEPGMQRYQVAVLKAANGAPQTEVQGVTLTFTPPPGLGLAVERVGLQAAGEPWIWGIAGEHTPVAGEWTLQATVNRPGVPAESITFDVAVEQPSPPQLLPPPDTGIGIPGPMAAAWRWLPSGQAGWALALAALAAALAIGLWQRRGRTPGRGPSGVRLALAGTAIVLGLVVGARAVVDVANQPPAGVAAVTNPMDATPDSVSRGRDIYLANCAVCHGTDGRGGLPPLQDVVPRLQDGALAYRIAVGTTGTRMPAFAATLSEIERWHLVNYLRSAFAASQSGAP